MKQQYIAVGLTMAVLLMLSACGGEFGAQLTPGEVDEVMLATRGEAKLPIVIGVDADPSLAVAAGELAEYLERISGAPFEVVTGPAMEGIFLGTADDFDDPRVGDLLFDDLLFGDGVFEQENYALRSIDKSLYLVGASPLAVRFAVWDLLYRFGHRQFFPTETWEVVPTLDRLAIAVDVMERPDFYNRQAPRGAMRMDLRPWADAGWLDWQMRNRATPTFTLHTGHAYDGVIAAHQQVFDSRPEFWGEIDGQRTDRAQPNVAHRQVQQLFIDHALAQLAADPQRQSVAMDPRDGHRWSESPESQAIGGPTEQAIHLANMVAQAMVEAYGDEKFVGIYGYSHHSPPPEVDVHPNVIVSLATEYIRGGYTFEELLDGWSQRTAMIGIRDYYGLWEWHYSLPGVGARAGDTHYLRESIPYYHARGARFINAESNDTWGAYGLGYYLAARMLWDVDEARRVDEIIDDFLSKAFGAAKAPMAQFYELIDGGSEDPYVPGRPRQLNDDMVGRMYRWLAQARQMADSDEVRVRIDDLILYTHYVELYRRFEAIEGPERQQAFDDLVGFAWRIRGTMMAESVELTRYIDRQVRTDDHLSWGEGYTRNGPADRHRIDEDLLFTEAEIEAMLQEGIANHQLLDLRFEPWVDSGQLAPAYLPPDQPGGPGPQVNRGSVEAVLATDDGTLPALTISAGHIFDDRGPLQWILRDEDQQVVDYGQVAPDQQEHHFNLRADGPGLYRLSIDNASQGFVWEYDSRGAMMTLLAGGDYELQRNWYSRLYFYVPQGIDAIYLAGTLGEGRHEFIDGDGKVINGDAIEVLQDYTIIDVSPGQDGQVWTLDLRGWRPAIRFLNIPGYVAFSPQELLLPREVIEELP